MRDLTGSGGVPADGARDDAQGPPARAEELPAPLTFFLNARERQAVLGALRRIHRDRRAALLRILRPLIDEEAGR